MAANDILIEYAATQEFNVTASHSPADPATDYTIASPTPVNNVLTQAGVASAAARQSNKADLGAKRSPLYECWASVDYTGETPAAGTVDYYWAPSTHTTPANGNVAGNSGVDADAPDGVTETGMTLAEFLKRCIFIGSLITTDSTTVQAGFVGYLASPSRYGQMVVVNNGGDAFEADDVESAVFLNPVHSEVA